MPRPVKCRKVCCLPPYSRFEPAKGPEKIETVSMTVEEFEIVRLIDWKGFSQERGAAEMGVARSTVQRIYGEARRKLADCLVNGKALKIEGGCYRLCGGRCPLAGPAGASGARD